MSYFTRSQLQLSLRKQNLLVRNFQCTDIFATGRETMIEGHDHGADSRWNVTPSSVVYHRTTGFGLDSKLARRSPMLCAAMQTSCPAQPCLFRVTDALCARALWRKFDNSRSIRWNSITWKPSAPQLFLHFFSITPNSPSIITLWIFPTSSSELDLNFSYKFIHTSDYENV